MNKIFLFLVLIQLPLSATADLFLGPNNYDECITEKMKGVDIKIWNLIVGEPSIRICERNHETKLKNTRGIDIQWASYETDEATMIIAENSSNFKVTRAKISFSMHNDLQR